MAQAPPIILSIAGFDPTSGAGITADIKTISAHGCYGMACVTGITVQSTKGVRRLQPTPPKLVSQTLEELASDVSFAAVRIGMLANAGVVEAVSKFLDRHAPPNVVLDPILKSSSGSRLLDRDGMRRLVRRLLPQARVTTPNVDEAAALTHLPVTNLEQMKAAALKLHGLGARNVVITGGHLQKPIDLLSIGAEAGSLEQLEFASERVPSIATHGTGCAFATALAANLALGKQLRDAVVLAKAYVTKAIDRAYPLGKGVGPINHLFRMDAQPRPVQDPDAGD